MKNTVMCRNLRLNKKPQVVTLKWCNLAQYDSWCNGCEHNKRRAKSKYQEDKAKGEK